MGFRSRVFLRGTFFFFLTFLKNFISLNLSSRRTFLMSISKSLYKLLYPTLNHFFDICWTIWFYQQNVRTYLKKITLSWARVWTLNKIGVQFFVETTSKKMENKEPFSLKVVKIFRPIQIWQFFRSIFFINSYLFSWYWGWRHHHNIAWIRSLESKNKQDYLN